MSIRTIAWDYLRRLVDEGLTKNAIQDVLKGVGLGYRRHVMLADIDVLLGRAVSERAIASFPKYFIPEDAYCVPTPKTLKQKYLYEFKATGKSLVTGEPEDRVFNMYTDQPIAIGDAESSMYDLVEDRGETYNFEIETITLKTPWKREEE